MCITIIFLYIDIDNTIKKSIKNSNILSSVSNQQHNNKNRGIFHKKKKGA